MKGISDELVEQAGKLDKEYFGDVTMERSIEVINSQASSMRPSSTKTNVYEQAGDLVFAVISLARNQGWNLERLLKDAISKVQKRRDSRHYYEAHITVEPVYEEDLERFKTICRDYKFSVAALLMKKRKEDTEERSKNDSFATGRGISYADIERRMLDLVARLQKEGFAVWRYKIESTLLDSRYDDSKLPLDKQHLPEKEKEPRPPADGALSGRIDADMEKSILIELMARREEI